MFLTNGTSISISCGYPFPRNLQRARELTRPRGEREIGERMAEAHRHSMDVAHGQGSLSPRVDPRVDPLGPATFHGNEPSRGAKIDAEIMAEEREELKRKGKA